MLPTIKFSTMLDVMEKFDSDNNPIVFSIKYIRFNRLFLQKLRKYRRENKAVPLDTCILNLLKEATENEKIGGIVFIQNAVLARNMKGITNTAAVREPIVTARSTIPDKRLRSSIRRLYLIDENKIRSCYLRLIIEFNSYQVIY